VQHGDGLLRALGERLVRLPRAGAWLLVLGWGAAITWMSSRAGTPRPMHWSLGVLFNGAHAVEFGLLAAWMSLLVGRRDGWPDLRPRRRAALLALVLVAGALDELHQHLWARGRNLSATDLVTDVAGAAATLEIVDYLGRPERNRRGLLARLALAALAATLAGGLSTAASRCFPDLWWF
jgi:hypothetical protein